MYALQKLKGSGENISLKHQKPSLATRRRQQFSGSAVGCRILTHEFQLRLFEALIVNANEQRELSMPPESEPAGTQSTNAGLQVHDKNKLLFFYPS